MSELYSNNYEPTLNGSLTIQYLNMMMQLKHT